ncbi:MAG: DNA recombination protein RmuC [Alphaproteobacteria bacterium]
MDGTNLVLLGLLVVVSVIVALVLARSARGRRDADALGEQLVRMAETITAGQHDLGGRLKHITETSAAAQAQLTERLHAQERLLAKTLEERLADISRRVGESLEKSSTQTHKTMSEVRERLAVIDAAQKNISELSGQVVSLQEVLSNRQARGAFGEVQLNDLVSNILPPSAYSFQTTLAGGQRADCLIALPNPPGPIAIDAKFPLESYHALRAARDDAAKTVAARAFRSDLLKHINDIAGKYIVPGETAESALMFLPSEAVYAELHANFADVVEKSYRARVWIVSPTTLWATLNTVRAVLKDVRMREQAGVIQTQVLALLEDVVRLDERVAKLQKHFEQTGEDVRQIRISTDKVTRKAERIEEIQLEDDSPAEEQPAPRLVETDKTSTGN